MQVKIKDFDVAPMEVKNNGIEFEVRTPDRTRQLGDLIVTRARLEWCDGRIRRGNGATKTCEEFIDRMNS